MQKGTGGQGDKTSGSPGDVRKETRNFNSSGKTDKRGARRPDGEGHAKTDGPNSPRKDTLAFILICIASGICVFAGLEYLLPPSFGSHETAVWAGFMLVPLGASFLMRRRPEIGKFDRGFLQGIGMYLLFCVPLLFLIIPNPDFYEGYRMSPQETAAWAFFTLVQVASVDFFTKRIIQLEVWQNWGKNAGIVVSFTAWMLGHIPEYFWLAKIATAPGAVAFLAATGLFTALLYSRTRNVLGMMLGHWILNLVLAAASVVLLGA